MILITTRKGSGGEAGNARVTYDSYFAVNVAKPHAEVLTADEFRRSRRGNDYGYNTDWYSLIMRDFSYDNNQYLAIDGSTKNGSYNASINYKNATGLDMNSEREEFGGRIAVEQRALDNRLQFNFSLNARRVNETYGEDGLFDTALNMKAVVDEAAATADIFISVAAVADWHVLAPSTQKIKKSSFADTQPMIALEENPDILAETARRNPHLYCVGFAAETQNIESYAREKLERKGVSLVVGNNAGLALGADLNSVVFVSKNASIAFEGISKLEVAQRLVYAIACNLGLCKGEIS